MENISLPEQSFVSEKKFFFFSKKYFLFLLSAVILIVIILFFIFSAPFNFPKGIIISVDKGDSLREISFSLKEKHIIRSRVAFETLVIVFGSEKHISQGDYLFEERLPVFMVAKRIAERDRHLASVKITIPEGFNSNEIAEAAGSQLRNFNKEKFLAEAHEGYLFPDTYFFFSSDTETEVLKYLTENFQKKLKPLVSDIVASGRSEKEIIIMASLIEKEAKGDIDRGYISGILWKRLSKGMPLQVDAAPETYKAKGLPKEPICNPGIKSIEASLHPVSSSYLYYLHDSEGGVHYARTFEEHKQNKLKYLK